MSTEEVARALAAHPNCSAMLQLHGIEDPCLGRTLDLTDERVVGLLLVRLYREAGYVVLDRRDSGHTVRAEVAGERVLAGASLEEGLGPAVGRALLEVWSVS